MYVGALWHASSAWYYVVPSLLLYLIDRLLRFHAASREVRVVRVASKGEVTELLFAMASGPLRHSPGQYVFLNVPAISPLQWHPFTLSSSPIDGA
eukprot:6799505-Prymnesium_polylepis.1